MMMVSGEDELSVRSKYTDDLHPLCPPRLSPPADLAALEWGRYKSLLSHPHLDPNPNPDSNLASVSPNHPATAPNAHGSCRICAGSVDLLVRVSTTGSALS